MRWLGLHRPYCSPQLGRLGSMYWLLVMLSRRIGQLPWLMGSSSWFSASIKQQNTGNVKEVSPDFDSSKFWFRIRSYSLSGSSHHYSWSPTKEPSWLAAWNSAIFFSVAQIIAENLAVDSPLEQPLSIIAGPVMLSILSCRLLLRLREAGSSSNYGLISNSSSLE